MYMIESDVRCVEGGERCYSVSMDFSTLTLKAGTGPFANVCVHSWPKKSGCDKVL